MIRVLHVIDSLDLGGAQTALLNLLRFADRSRFHHEVAAMHGEGFFAQAFRDEGVPVHSLSARRIPPQYLWRLPMLLERGKFDVLHCHLFGANWIAKPIGALAGVRVRYHHDQCNDALRSRSPLFTLIDAWTNQLSTRVLAVSRSVERFAREVEDVPAERITYLPNGVDCEEFVPARSDQRDAARNRFGLPLNAVVVGGVGRFVEQKNFELLLEASRPLLDEIPDLHVLLIGSGPDEAKLKLLAEQLGSKVRIHESVRERTDVYAALDLLVLPSKYEGLPLTILEAMASGVPVLASNVDGVREIVTNHPTVLVPFQSANLADLRHHLRDLVCNPPTRTPLAENGRRFVSRNFDVRELALRLEQLYMQDVSA